MNHTFSRLRTTLVPLLAALVLAGCATSTPIDASSLPTTPPAFRNQDASRVLAAAPSQVQSQDAWWSVFADPVLDQLVEQAGR
ncbi:MAG: efflux transporter outer membrane subunit, partial [Polaromonas sp.]